MSTTISITTTTTTIYSKKVTVIDSGIVFISHSMVILLTQLADYGFIIHP